MLSLYLVIPWYGVPAAEEKVPIFTAGTIAPVTGSRPDTYPVRDERLNEGRLRGCVVSGRIERRQRIALAKRRLNEVEPDSQVEGQVLRWFPGVLEVPFNVVVASVCARVAVRFGVAIHHAEQSIRIGVSGVQRIIRIAIESEGSIERGGAGGVARSVFPKSAELQAVLPGDPGVVIRQVPDVIRSEEGKAPFDAQIADVRDAAVVESGVRNQVERIRLRIELRNR